MKFSLCTIAMLVMCGLCFGSQPRPRENDLFKMEVAGFVVSRSASGPQLKYIFGFATKKPGQITRVKVEDITERESIVLVDDKEPKIEKNRWSGHSAITPVTSEKTPWMFDNRTTKMVFRITVSTAESDDKEVVQPATYPASAKKMMLQIASKPKKS
jgi:hypothetical protein